MKIIYKQGNLLDAPEGAILHGVNCQGVMGSGVAKAIRAKWPEAYAIYKAAEASEEGLRLGGVSLVWVSKDKKMILNAVTQQYYGREPNKQYCSYTAICEAIKRINWYCPLRPENHQEFIAMPKIGAGLGGGDWDIISQIIEEESINFQPVVYCLEE